MEWWLAYFAVGAAAGFFAGMFGIGGGAIIVPVLYEAYALLGVDEAVRMHVSVGTSMAVMIPTGIRSFRAHYVRGSVDMAVFKSWLLPMPLGVAVGSIVAAYVSGKVLAGVFAAIAASISFRMLFGGERWRLGSDLPGEPWRAVAGWVIAFLSTLMGIAGGNLVNAYMTLYGRAMIQAVGTASAVGIIISAPAAIGYIWAGWGVPGLPPFSAGYVNLLGVLALVPISVLAAPFGVKLAHALTRRQLEVGFGLFLAFVSARFLITLF
jgi:uncharacterized membrane protein YfcA